MDQPLWVQFSRFMANAARGDFGASTRSGHPAMQDVLAVFPKTAYLGSVAMLLAIAWAVPAGMISATHEGGVVDFAFLAASLVGQSMPVFWVGIVFITIFGVHLRWFPIGGSQELSSVVLPAASLAILFGSSLIRQVRVGMAEVLRTDYVRTAHAKGLPARRVLYKHALRNALLPVVTVIGLQTGTLLGGAVITETVFGWPGLGRLIVGAIGGRDFPVVQAGVFVLAVLFVVTVALTDLLYLALDPRVTYSSEAR
jgi:peptide/nickel transport system permease protein